MNEHQTDPILSQLKLVRAQQRLYGYLGIDLAASSGVAFVLAERAASARIGFLGAVSLVSGVICGIEWNDAVMAGDTLEGIAIDKAIYEIQNAPE